MTTTNQSISPIFNMAKPTNSYFEGHKGEEQLQEAQLPQRNSASAAHMEGAKPSSPLPPGYTYAYGRIRNPHQTYAKHAVRKAHFKLNRAFKVI